MSTTILTTNTAITATGTAFIDLFLMFGALMVVGTLLKEFFKERG